MVAFSQIQSINFEKICDLCSLHSKLLAFCDGRRFCLTFTVTALDVITELLIYILINWLLMVKSSTALINVSCELCCVEMFILVWFTFIVRCKCQVDLLLNLSLSSGQLNMKLCCLTTPL